MPAGAQTRAQPVGGLLHPPIVEVDAVAADVLDREPVAGVEMPPRRARALAEQRVVLVEAFEQRARDRAGLSRDALLARGAAALTVAAIDEAGSQVACGRAVRRERPSMIP